MKQERDLAAVVEHPSSRPPQAADASAMSRWLRFHLRFNHAERAMAILLVALPFALSSAALATFFVSFPQTSPYASPAAMAAYRDFVAAWSLLLGLSAVILFVGRRGRLNSQYSELSAIWLTMAGLSIALFYFGVFTSALLTAVVCVGMMSFVLCERRAVLVALVAFVVVQLLLVAGEQSGLIPYAPLVTRSPVYGGQLHWSWNLGVGMFSLVLCGVAFVFVDSLVRQIRAQAARLEQLAVTDPLTGISNRRRFFEDAARELARVSRRGVPASCLLIDIDHFKRLNDTFGHQLGDEALRLVAQTIASTLRTEDSFARYGGEEFVALLPDTDPAGGQRVGERLRREVSKLILPHHGQTVTMTISIGVAGTPAHTQPEISALLAAADAALYAAKDAGRDRVELAAKRA